jgi:hypothetical protein
MQRNATAAIVDVVADFTNQRLPLPLPRRRTRPGRRAWPRRPGRGRARGPIKMALGDRDVIDAPAFTGATVVAGHPPAQLTINNKRRKVHCRRDETARVAAPCVTASDRTASSGGDYRVIAARIEGAANGWVGNVRECTVVNIER